jgi:hypothetical protein
MSRPADIIEAPPPQVKTREQKTPLSFEKRGFHDRPWPTLRTWKGSSRDTNRQYILLFDF